MYTFPAASTATPKGLFSRAVIAGPPSPENPRCWQTPANVVMTPAPSTLRMQWLYVSAM
jgi:hypothetical protein